MCNVRLRQESSQKRAGDFVAEKGAIQCGADRSDATAGGGAREHLRISFVCFRHTFANSGCRARIGMKDRNQFIVECKSCRLDVPAGVEEFPFRSILVTCPLCGELHRYLPSEMIMARPNSLVAKQAQAGTR